LCHYEDFSISTKKPMQMLEFIEELAKKICEIELCVSNLSGTDLERQPVMECLAVRRHCLPGGINRPGHSPGEHCAGAEARLLGEA
jgi:hypothetical protein